MCLGPVATPLTARSRTLLRRDHRTASAAGPQPRHGLRSLVPWFIGPALSVLTAGCSAHAEFATGAGPAAEESNSCEYAIESPPTAVVEAYQLDPAFYRRYCAVYGVPIIAPDGVDDEVLRETGRLAAAVLGAAASDVRDAVHDRYLRIVITAASTGQAFEDLPELADLFPEEASAAGLGPTPDFPAVVVRDSVILCRSRLDRPYATPPGDTLVHELGHALLSMGLLQRPGTFAAYLLSAYEHARRDGLWQRRIPDEVENVVSRELPRDNYLMSNPEEYFATALSSYVGFKGITIGYGLRRISSELAAVSELRVHGPQEIGEIDPELTPLLQWALPHLIAPEHHCAEWLDNY